MDKAEMILKECIDDLLEEEIKAIPTEEELKKQHKFSGRFQKNMNQLIKENKRRNVFKIYKALGACAAVVVLGVITVNVLSPYWELEKTDVYENAIEEMTTESAMEETEDTTATSDSADVYSYGIKSSYGEEVNVSGISEEPIGLQVNAVYEENGWELCLQIHNNGENSIQFMEDSYMLEVWQEDGWYVVTTKEGSKTYELLPGIRYDNNILLEDEISKEHTYRLLCMFDGEIKGYVFNVE